METIIKVIPILIAAATATWGIYTFKKQQKFNRLQNLAKILQRFGDTRQFLEIFNLFDQSLKIENGQIGYDADFLNELKDVNAENKWQFLVLMEEVALYARSFAVDRDYAVHLFQWHFYYVYNNEKTAMAFWEGIGGVSEKDKHYWEYQRSFAAYCKPI